MADTPEQQAYQPEIILNGLGERLVLRFNVQNLLEESVGENWQEEVAGYIESSEPILRKPDGHYTNREHGTTAELRLITADGEGLAHAFPGLWDLYQGPFKEMMQQALPEGDDELRTYDDPSDIALEGLAQAVVKQTGDSVVQNRMEAHVDLRWTAVLVIDVPEDDAIGGRLVVANRPDAQSPAEILQDATFIKHIPGTLVCFSQGRKYPHFTEEITDGRRVVISMNYPNKDETEEDKKRISDYIRGVGE